MRLIHVRVSKYIGDTVEDWIIFRTRLDYPAAGLALVVTPVAYPAFAKHTLAKAAQLAAKGVGAGTQADYRDAPVAGSIKVFVHLIGPGAKTQQHDDGICRVQCLRVGEALLVVGINLPLVIQGKEDGALEPMTLTHNLGHHRQAFLTAILLIAGEKNDMLALA